MLLRLALVLSSATFLAAAARMQNFVVAQSQTEERPTGLLALPEVFGENPCDLIQPTKLDLYATPSKQLPPIATIERANPPRSANSPDCEEPVVVVRRINEAGSTKLPMDESGYEILKAIVYEQSGNWFRIALTRGSAWIERLNTEGLFAYPEHMNQEELATYLRRGWDGNIWTTPGGTPTMAPAGWQAHMKEEIPVRVTETRVVRGEKWMRLAFENETCGRSLGNLPALEAWLPAYRLSRATSVWFHSRGC